MREKITRTKTKTNREFCTASIPSLTDARLKSLAEQQEMSIAGLTGELLEFALDNIEFEDVTVIKKQIVWKGGK